LIGSAFVNFEDIVSIEMLAYFHFQGISAQKAKAGAETQFFPNQRSKSDKSAVNFASFILINTNNIIFSSSMSD